MDLFSIEVSAYDYYGNLNTDENADISLWYAGDMGVLSGVPGSISLNSGYYNFDHLSMDLPGNYQIFLNVEEVSDSIPIQIIPGPIYSITIDQSATFV